MQEIKKKRGNPRWKKGESGNPAGRPKDPEKLEIMALVKNKSPELVKKAFDMVLCEDPNIEIMKALIRKVLPDNLNIGGDLADTLGEIARRLARRQGLTME